ncbi:MFS transporter, partial [Streptomyces sp. NRRL F-6602]
FGVLEIVAAFAPSVWIFAVLMVLTGMFGLTVNVTANSYVQMATEPQMRGRVMALFMMVFTGGTPLGAPLLGWITDEYGARTGFAVGGAISLLAALAVGLILARVGGLKVKVDLRRGRKHIRFVPDEKRLAPAA